MDFCTIGSGSSGNCTYIGTDQSALLVDVGLTGKRIEEGLRKVDRSGHEIDAIVLTHEHIDHISGLGVMARRYHIPIYATRGTLDYIVRSKSLGAIDPSLLFEIREEMPFQVGDMEILPFSIWHDAAQPVGFRISHNDRSIAVATDMGCYDDKIVKYLSHLDGIVLESNHDVNMLEVGPYPWPLKQRILGQKGHLSNESAGNLLCDILHDGMKQIVLGHLSKENNYEALAYATVSCVIDMGDNPYRADSFPIEVARRDQPSKLFHV